MMAPIAWNCLRMDDACLQGPGMKVSVLDTEVGLYHHRSKGVDWVFVDHPSYPRPGGLYADAFGVYGDNQVHQQGNFIVYHVLRLGLA